MILLEKIFSILKVSESDVSVRDRLARRVVVLFNMFCLVTMIVEFFVSMFCHINVEICSVAIVWIVLYSMLLFFSTNINLQKYSRFCFFLTIISASVSMQLLPFNLAIFHVFVCIAPTYIVAGFSRKTSVIVCSLEIAYVIMICVWQNVDFINLSVVAIAILLIYSLFMMIDYFTLYYVNTQNSSINTIKHDVNKQHEYILKMSQYVKLPISNMLNISHKLESKIGTEERKHLLESLVANIETVSDIVAIIDGEASNNIKKDDYNKNNVYLFDLAKLITHTAELTRGMELKLEVYGKLPKLKGDTVKLRKILLNIFDFLLQNTPEDQLTAQASIIINRVRIPLIPIKYRFDVKSDISIDESVVDRPNLDIAQRIVKEMGGNIKYRFDDDMTYIYFNVCFEGIEDDETTNTDGGNTVIHVNETAGFVPIAKAKTLAEADVIVCDDNPINQKVMSLSLEKHVRSIALASNGQECVDLVMRGDYDIVLMDIQMPILDGYEATIQIRRHEESTKYHIPIIAVTANTLTSDRQHCLSIGMDDYVSKPFSVNDVIDKITALIQKYPLCRA